jgi:uncharacterized membrane protein
VSDLIIAVYRSETAAFVAGDNLVAMQHSAGTEAEDIVVVTRDKTGRVSVNQSIDLATGEPLAGGRWGALIGLLFLDSGKGAPKGKGLAARFGATGLDARFVQEVGGSLEKGGAAVGMRVRLLGRDRVVDMLKSGKGSPKILWTRLSPDAEDALVDMHDQIPDSAVHQVQPNDAF